MTLELWYRYPGINEGLLQNVKRKLQNCLPEHKKIISVESEICFYVQTTEDLTIEDTDKVQWILHVPFETNNLSRKSKFSCKPRSIIVEIGPRLNFSTAFSTNVVSMCHTIGIGNVNRVEHSCRYFLQVENGQDCEDGDKRIFTKAEEDSIVNCLHDKMTHCRYTEPIKSFNLDVIPDDVYEVDVLGGGQKSLEKANVDLGLAFDNWDLEYYTSMFKEKVKRNPTSVECFDLAQSNSEHSRHWFFKGRMVVDGVEKPDSLFKMVMDTQKFSNQNNIIKFNDNSSAIQGFAVSTLCPTKHHKSSHFQRISAATRHLIYTAETHNFPTGVAPFPGATTGTGGRIRDVQATGRGAHVIAGTAGYSFGNLNIPGYSLPWEDETFDYPPNFAKPKDVAIEASNGASDYGNKFGEPVLTGFARSFGMALPNGERREWVKPIMFSGGIGSMEEMHSKKCNPEKGMEIVKIGGPIYRIGVGGGAASSIQVQGDNDAHLDLGAVQRGDAEMEQKMNRLLRACIEMRERNPICSIHDQGAGGNGNVLKEICEPSGALIYTGAFQLGDPTLSIMEIWGAEYQESNAILIRPEDKVMLMKIGQREKCPIDFVGTITDTGKIQLVDDRKSCVDEEGEPNSKQQKLEYPVDLNLELVLGQMPQKTFKLNHLVSNLRPLVLPENITVKEALARVLKLPSVASKRYLTNKVDRAVTGLVAQQQCVGPLHTPLADVAVVALSHFDTVGGATAIGEQPIKGLVDAKCGARMTVGEALTNLVCAQVTDLKDVKCSGNWMWAAKLPGEGALLYDACEAMCEVMNKLGVAIDGGKDSLSMAARVGQDTVKAPGTLVVSAYVGCPDITATLTPDLKCPNGQSSLLWVRFGSTKSENRLGGSALAQCYKQLGDVSPDLDNPELFAHAFNTTQCLNKANKLLSAHDISDGGLVTCVLEMAFAGNCGIKCSINSQTDVIPVLFAEELGLVVEVDSALVNDVSEAYNDVNVQCYKIGETYDAHPQDCKVVISFNNTEILNECMTSLRDQWEETSFQLEYLQTNSECVDLEKTGMKSRKSPPFQFTFNIDSEMQSVSDNSEIISNKPCVAVVREEGSNGDREMVSALFMAGFEVWDVNMYDLCNGEVNLDIFRGVVFVGGFSYADAMGSAKGWAAGLKFNAKVKCQLDKFYNRSDTFSLGVCNGCQLMALLGWVAPGETTNSDKSQGVHLAHNQSERFESRFVSVRIQNTPAIMLKGMEDSVLGIWVQHGEGKFAFKNKELHSKVASDNLIPMQYVDDDGQPTEVYPFNPNGSISGIAGLCSSDGRHLAMMPHPERCIKAWQWPWMPLEWRKQSMNFSPWMTMFVNAYKWCKSTG